MIEYDAILIVSFGGPEGPGEVLPFLERVTRKGNVPPARLGAVAERYYERGGVSPINAINRRLRELVEKELAVAQPALPVYWGNRNWHPFLADAVRQMQVDGVRTALAFLTSAFASYSSCRQYQENLAQARAEVGDGAPVLHRLRHYFDHPGFIEPFARATVEALATLGGPTRDDAHLVFTAHAIPDAMAAASGPTGGAYAAQVRTAAHLVRDRVTTLTGHEHEWSVAYQSRSGVPGSVWLGPDVSEHLVALHGVGVRTAVVVPVGFTADHMEVVHDLDVEAAGTAAAMGMAFARAATPGLEPEFVAMVAELVRERVDPAMPRRHLSPLGPSHDVCPLTCCLSLQGQGERG